MPYLANHPETIRKFVSVLDALRVEMASEITHYSPDEGQRLLNSITCAHAIMFWLAVMEAGGPAYWDSDQEMFGWLCEWREEQEIHYDGAEHYGWVANTANIAPA